MKIALVHDWLIVDAGAEKCLKEFNIIYNNANIYSIVDFLSDIDRKKIINSKITHNSFIQKLPFAKKQFRNYLPLFPKAIESFDLKGYDLVISSSWAVAKGIKTSNKQIHICYCHTPIRYAWDLYDEYTSDLKQPKKFFVQQSLKYIRKWDIKTLNRVDYFIANSKFVQERIKRIYNKNSQVIYPPVDINKFNLYLQKENFYLTVSRLVAYKKTKLIVEAFNKMPNRKLIVIGHGEEFNEIKKIAKSNIKVLGYQTDRVLISYMQRARAFMYCAIEDFGIVPIEAMACGTPIIALNKGGTAETVIDRVNGIHFENQNIKDIIGALNRFEKIKFDYNKISNYAKRFSIDRFHNEIKKFVRYRYEKSKTK